MDSVGHVCAAILDDLGKREFAVLGPHKGSTGRILRDEEERALEKKMIVSALSQEVRITNWVFLGCSAAAVIVGIVYTATLVTGLCPHQTIGARESAAGAVVCGLLIGVINACMKKSKLALLLLMVKGAPESESVKLLETVVYSQLGEEKSKRRHTAKAQ
jgi:hypothetical protein